jgi:hypothetical protein
MLYIFLVIYKLCFFPRYTKGELTMWTTEVVKEGELLTVIVNKVIYKVYGENENRTMYISSNLTGRVPLEKIKTSTLVADQVENEVHEAISIMNDHFLDLPKNVTLFKVLDIILVEQPV